jgi:alcohol dehydrogenase, propanol-preferring
MSHRSARREGRLAFKKPTPPFIPGHEAIGTVTAAGASARTVKEGGRIEVPWLYSACGHCEYCLSAWETVCPDAQFGGYTRNGGFAEYLLAKLRRSRAPRSLVDRSRSIDLRRLNHLQRNQAGRSEAGEWVAISGVEALGHLAIQ